MALSRSILALTAALLLFLSAITGSAAAEGAFLSEMEDLPLPDGLTEAPGGMLFDSPTGRILEATATGTVSPDQVRAFYAQTLPELGWQKLGPSSYRRDNELLKIEIEAKRRPMLVHFSVVPQ
ncbi:hypothetical protein [Telmatospirillum siberiense]|uniref:Uncharacterized protein n=1 Tax=Telmatospirillum siberiense TaxID=382514 RepID=A0A2N3PSH1_9PROT|nr:hypothetical protein [Telmatospirillum siberiense]PKU23351.1 hypothetical protein CWS72_17110 [Telmatospirillum siberiense]